VIRYQSWIGDFSVCADGDGRRKRLSADYTD
jgi:hypothetical protein